MSAEYIVLVGAGGHAKVLIDLIRSANHFAIKGLLDPRREPGTLVLDSPILGDDSLLHQLFTAGIRNACIAIGSVRDNRIRLISYQKVKAIGYTIPTLIHPRAIVSNSGTSIAEGAQIMAGAIVQPESYVGKNTIINSGAVIEHDCQIGDHVHVCPGAIVSGGCHIGEQSFIGAGAVIIQGISIGRGVIIGAGAVVIGDVPDGNLVKGVPAR